MAYGKAGDWYVNNNEGSGGGGESDFSTAEVEILVNDNTKLFIPAINNGTPFTGLYPFPNIGDEGGTVDVVLYKGSAMCLWTGEARLNISGNIELIQSGMYKITGDCKIQAQIS